MKVEIFEGKRAEDYDRNIPLIFPGYFDVLKKIDALLSGHLHPRQGNKLLVNGCGTGSEMDFFLQNHPDWQITGIDPSPEMIRKAGDKLFHYPSGSYNLANVLVSDLPLEIKFDAATLQLVLHFLPDNGDKLNLLAQMAQRLAPGAYFVLVDICGDKNLLHAEFNRLEDFLISQKIPAPKIEKLTKHIRHDIYPCTEARELALLQEAGFNSVEKFYHDYMYCGWIAAKKN